MSSISKKGLVVENNNGKVKVMIQRDSGCGSCSSCGGCETKPSFITTNSMLDLNPGDEVFLESNYSSVSHLTKFIYIFPVAMIIIGVLVANLLFKNTNLDLNLLTILFIILFFALSIGIIHLFDKKYEGRNFVTVRKA